MKYCYLAAPVLLLGYGLARMIDGIDGSRGPGPAWTIGHLLYLISLGLFGVVLVGLRNALPRYRAAGTVAVVAGAVGLVAFVRVVVVDIIVGLRAVDRAGMHELFLRYERSPGFLPSGLVSALDLIGQVFFPASVILLTVLVATVAPRRLRWWSPVLTVVGFALFGLNLDLLPLGAVAMVCGLLPMTGVSAGRGPVVAVAGRR
ncbi:hypothetical protein [Plantactinospora sp. B5E13]|uniref:hypothetical protein n=1 Tax=unclassified Plantactinospora TaxID=2631981 RepID=UPI00325CDCEE